MCIKIPASAFIVIAIAICLFASCEKRGESGLQYHESRPAPQPTKEEVELALGDSMIEMVELVKDIKPYLDHSVEEGWDIAQWRTKAGEPMSTRRLSKDLIILEYHDRSYHQTKHEKLIIGVNIWIKNGSTEKWDWQIKSFGE